MGSLKYEIVETNQNAMWTVYRISYNKCKDPLGNCGLESILLRALYITISNRKFLDLIRQLLGAGYGIKDLMVKYGIYLTHVGGHLEGIVARIGFPELFYIIYPNEANIKVLDSVNIELGPSSYNRELIGRTLQGAISIHDMFSMIRPEMVGDLKINTKPVDRSVEKPGVYVEIPEKRYNMRVLIRYPSGEEKVFQVTPYTFK